MKRIERIKKSNSTNNIWKLLIVVAVTFIVILFTFRFFNPDKLKMYDSVKNTYLVEVVGTTSEFKYDENDKKYYLDVLSNDGIIVQICTKNKETIDKLIAIKPQETIRFIGNGVEILDSINDDY